MTTDKQRRTAGRHITPRSPYFIRVRAGRGVTEEQNQRRHSTRLETAGNRRRLRVCQHPDELRRLVTTCGFLLRRLNYSDQSSDNYRHSSVDLAELVDLSGSEDESAHPRRPMSQQYRTSHNHRPADASTTNNHARAPSEIFALIEPERILVTITEYGWRVYIRRETPTEYIVRYENAAGVLSGRLSLNRREARRFVTETRCEAVWIDLQDRSAWPGEETTEVSDG